MSPPLNDYVIKGTVYETFTKGRTEVEVTIGSGAGTTQDIYIVGDSGLAKSQTLTCYNLTQDTTYSDPQTITTSSTTGKYILSCNNFTTTNWAEGDVILIIASNLVQTDRDKQEDDFLNRMGNRVGARARVLVDQEGNEIEHENPLPIVPINIDLQDGPSVMTYSGGNIATETKTINGVDYKKTYTWSAGTLTNETKWVRQ